MALKFKLDSIDDLDEGVQGLYKEADDGGFVLDVEGAVSRDRHNEFVNNNKRLFKENEELAGFKTKAQELQEQLDQAGQAGKQKETDLNTRVSTLEQLVEKERQEKAAAQDALNTTKKNAQISKALKGAGVRDAAIDDATALASQEWGFADDGTLVRQLGGQTVLSEDTGAPQGLDEWAKGLHKTKSYLFETSQGDGAQPVPVVGGKKVYDITRLGGAELAAASDEVAAGKAKWAE